LKLDAARNQLKQNPDETNSLLVELKSQTQSAIEDIRRLVYNLRPPALDELGLFSAIQEYAANHLRAGLSVRIERKGDFPKLPATVEVAAYRIVCEALTNVSKHSHATKCDVRFMLNDALQIDIQDNGPSALLTWLFYNSDGIKPLEFNASIIGFKLPIDLYL
jgi:two-component system, NarL family, sensor kinase